MPKGNEINWEKIEEDIFDILDSYDEELEPYGAHGIDIGNFQNLAHDITLYFKGTIAIKKCQKVNLVKRNNKKSPSRM
jgi:hypothetical protein